jgi:hypothetical protein
MGKLTHLMIHCAATIDGQDIRPEDIERMHIGAKVYANGTVHYKGKKYPSIEALPSDDFIGDVPAKKTRGRGWSRVGYSKFWTLDGEVHTLREYDEDNWIDNNEYTNGALGMNSKTRHFCYAGGLSKDKRRGRRYAFLTMTKAQEESLIAEIKSEIKNHPHILVCGHNQYANKGCPSMNTVLWLNVHGIPEENIDKSKMRTVLQPVFENKYQGNDFRKWVNDNHADYAREIDLDASGSHTNDYITKAYYKLRHQYNAQNKDS